MDKICGLIALWAGALGTACVSSYYNLHGEVELTGALTQKTNECGKLEKKLGVEEKDDCTSTIAVETPEGKYVIGVLGQPEDNLTVGSKVKFLKQSSYWVTSFNQNNQGFLTAGNIKKL
ncbi:MAG: hypothetical protein KJ600_05305 [Nanoarchaeota archaeon]|nr:hypothetical protein [Nanoarchaeota archaeon]